MRIIGVLLSVAIIVFMLVDAFETILQPRRVTHRYRFARLFYRGFWEGWRSVALGVFRGKRREAFLSIFAPLSLLALIATWSTGLVIGFGLLHWSLGTPLNGLNEPHNFWTYLYLSGTTLFTLGYGDFTPLSHIGRTLAVVEAGLGLGFLAVIVSYLPVLYQAFSRREVAISLLDARAGSPPSAAQFLTRLARAGSLAAADPLLLEWEHWAAELLESHLSFPVLSFYRSQHDNQSWLSTLTCILDSCALLIVEVKGVTSYQAQLTFAMARHAAVDLALVLKVTPRPPDVDRLAETQRLHLRELLGQAGLVLHDATAGDDKLDKLTELRAMYEPFIAALGERLLVTIPPILVEEAVADNWQRSAWMRRPPGIGHLPPDSPDEHFR